MAYIKEEEEEEEEEEESKYFKGKIFKSELGIAPCVSSYRNSLRHPDSSTVTALNLALEALCENPPQPWATFTSYVLLRRTTRVTLYWTFRN